MTAVMAINKKICASTKFSLETLLGCKAERDELDKINA